MARPKMYLGVYNQHFAGLLTILIRLFAEFS
jgi:hypothetical protein